jgi:hypothetical protein
MLGMATLCRMHWHCCALNPEIPQLSGTAAAEEASAGPLGAVAHIKALTFFAPAVNRSGGLLGYRRKVYSTACCCIIAHGKGN